MRRAARVDRNHAEITAALRKVGATVCDLSAAGEGCPDLLVGYRGRNFLMEVKDPKQPPSKRKLTPAQEDFRNGWKGQYAVVQTIDDALTVLGLR